ncbi:uncharacterized protein C19orf47 homolog isoform X2 [Cryptotermes secundus]|uniref:uncharacterized protein C19orf47 homolog isoform X2 n=1 Tax=Cryptotermes secundus TaxID=105785 RepID=UPI000CD7C1ED|nr:uncharacterized protein C19orf47 homolog isoform X2 [Cryptotermes secundus]
MAAVTNTWIKFFTDAGIPAGIAASYALTFSNNRIRMDMLLDLNKEYLKDMGITLMGDVIGILRHAKHVHEQNVRDKILGTSANAPLPQKSTPASRMLDHYMRKTDTNSSDGGGSGSGGGDGDVDDTAVSLEKQKTSIPSTSLFKAKKQTLKTKSEQEVQAPPLKKVRRVLPEHEGRYKITMPSGSTPRTQKILAKQGLLTQKKKTVFDRLGDGSVTSTTESEGPSITITGLGLNIVKPASSMPEKSSVFLRLGEKSQVSSTSNQDILEGKTYLEDIPVSRESVLPYAGVFKQERRKKTVKKVHIQKIEVPTMQADIESARQHITEDGRLISKIVQVQERLGASLSEGKSLLHTLESPNNGKVVKKIIRTNKTTAGILANPTNAKKLSVKARLGSSDSEASSSTTEPAIRRKKIVFVKKTGEKVTTPINRAQDLRLNTTATKSVTFGGVTKKTFMPREVITSSTNCNTITFSNNVTSTCGIHKGPGSITTKTGVFSRLGS